MSNVHEILEQEHFLDICDTLRSKPQIDMPKHWLGFKQRPIQTTPEAWREAFTIELEATKDPLAQKSFETILKLIEIAAECGATNLAFKATIDERTMTLVLENIWFPKKTMCVMLDKFRRRLVELD